MKVAVLSPVAWRTPPEKYGPWEQMASNTAEGLLKLGVDVTLFATGNSAISNTKLEAVCEEGYAESTNGDAKVMECMHISNLMEQADRFDIIHNHFDFLPLTYSRLINVPMVTTVHGFSSDSILPVYKKYNDHAHYVSISDSSRHPELDYEATVYNGVRRESFNFSPTAMEYFLFFGRIHPDKGTHEAIQIARASGVKLLIAGLIQDQEYFDQKVRPYLNHSSIVYLGNLGPVARQRLMSTARALLHPIQFEEPFGLSVAEAMMCGTPVIAYNRGSMKELIIEGETGFVVNNHDQALEVIPRIASLSRQTCRQHALTNFTMEKMAQGYLNVYETILSRSQNSIPFRSAKAVKQVV